jgi:hypothetical protein
MQPRGQFNGPVSLSPEEDTGYRFGVRLVWLQSWSELWNGDKIAFRTWNQIILTPKSESKLVAQYCFLLIANRANSSYFVLLSFIVLLCL